MIMIKYNLKKKKLYRKQSAKIRMKGIEKMYLITIVVQYIYSDAIFEDALWNKSFWN